MTPHSRHTAIDEEALAEVKELEVLSRSNTTGSNIIATRDFRRIFIMGHLEYGKDTLAQEYFRDPVSYTHLCSISMSVEIVIS